MVLFDKIALIGVGLIGSSIAWAARRGRLAGHIAGYTPRPETLAARGAPALPICCMANFVSCVTDADLVVLAAPVGAYGALAAEIAPHLKPGAILTDVGSVKMAVVRDVGPACAGRRAFHSRPSHCRHRAIRDRKRVSPNCSTIAGAS